MDWSAEALYSSTIQAPRRTMALVSRVEKYVEGASTRSWWRQLLRTVVDFRSGPSHPIHPSPSLHHYFSRGNRLVERIQYSILATFFNRDDNPRFIRDDERLLEEGEEKSTGSYRLGRIIGLPVIDSWRGIMYTNNSASYLQSLFANVNRGANICWNKCVKNLWNEIRNFRKFATKWEMYDFFVIFLKISPIFNSTNKPDNNWDGYRGI